jgi:GNAT superfamily N-acetyltransferase
MFSKFTAFLIQENWHGYKNRKRKFSMPVYEKFQNFFIAAPDGIKQITLSFDQIKIILRENLPEEAYKESEFWNNNIINSNGPSRTWLEAGWKVTYVNFFEHRVDFGKSIERSTQPSVSFKEKLASCFKQYLIKWFNRYPDDPEHYIGIISNSGKTYWLVIDEDFPYEMIIMRFGNRCGSLKFSCIGNSIEIRDIILEEEYRHDGVGFRTLKFFLSQAKMNGFEQVNARVQAEGEFPLEKLMSWYEKLGFIASEPGSRLMIR